jgi:hypothetical protein
MNDGLHYVEHLETIEIPTVAAETREFQIEEFSILV